MNDFLWDSSDVLLVLFQFNIQCSKSKPKPEKKEAPKAIGKIKKTLSKKEQIAILSAEVKKLDKQRRYEEVSQAYEKLIHLQPSASTYYEYGNALSNAKIYKKAKAAFLKSISLESDYEKRRHSYYNVACMASLLHNEKEAFKYLRDAISAGYNNLIHIKRDPDLQWLRQQPSFTSWLKNAESPAGKLVSSMGGMPFHQYFCGSPGEKSGKYASTPNSLHAYNAIFDTGKRKTLSSSILQENKDSKALGKIGRLGEDLQITKNTKNSIERLIRNSR